MKTLLAALLLVPSLAAAEYRYNDPEEEKYQAQQREMDRSSWPAEEEEDDEDTRPSSGTGIAIDPQTGRVSPVIIVR